MRYGPSLSNHSQRFLAFAATTLLANGCTDSTECETDDCETTDVDGKADGTMPTSTTGTLTLSVPASAAGALYVQRTNGTPVQMQPGVARNLAPGKYCFWSQLTFSFATQTFKTQPDCSIEIKAMVATTYPVGTVQFVHGRNEVVFGFDRYPVNAAATAFAAFASPIAHASGVFTYTVSSDEPFPFPFTVTGGASTTIDVTNPAGVRAIRLLPSTNRTLPNANPGHPKFAVCDQGVRNHCGALVSDEKPWLFVRATGGVNVGFFPYNSNARVGNAYFPASGITDLQLRRIDLNHVRVTHLDNTVQTIPGKATIKAVETTAGATMAAALVTGHPTGFGLDVPPAKYIVTTEYVDPADGAPMTIEETLDLR